MPFFKKAIWKKELSYKGFWGFVLAACLMLILVRVGPDSLARGQVMKSFFTYSIAESLANHGWRILESDLPCSEQGISRRPWVEEPPIFHVLGGLGIRFGFHPAVIPMLITVLLAYSFFLVARRGFGQSAENALLTTTLLTLTPAFARYSVQFIPDVLAIVFLMVGFYLLTRTKKPRRGWAVVAFTLACTTKVLCIFPIAGFFWIPWLSQSLAQRKWNWRQAANYVILIGVMILPFVIWVGVIAMKHLPSPFSFGHMLENRHSGELGYLFHFSYWRRFFTWNCIKGAGWVLFPLAMRRCWQVGRQMIKKGLFTPSVHPLDRYFFFWSLAVIPYWLLVRWGNSLHPHYSLPFIVAFGFLGAVELLSLKSEKLKYSLISVSIVLGMMSALDMRVADYGSEGRPYFCHVEREFWSSGPEFQAPKGP